MMQVTLTLDEQALGTRQNGARTFWVPERRKEDLFPTD